LLLEQVLLIKFEHDAVELAEGVQVERLTAKIQLNRTAQSFIDHADGLGQASLGSLVIEQDAILLFRVI